MPWSSGVMWCPLVVLKGLTCQMGRWRGWGKEGHSVEGECSFGSAGLNFLEVTPEHRYF